MPADRLLHPRLGHSVKVCGLSDFEHRIWVTYQLASDDYGVMRMSALTVQAANDSLAPRQATIVQKALERLVSVGLVDVFEHQGRRYCFQLDWQNFQRVKHPRDTMQPAPPEHLLAKCSAATQKLFAEHPSKKSAELPQDVGNISEMDPQPLSEIGSLARARTRETANGKRLMANGSSEESPRETAPPLETMARELVKLYPAQGACSVNNVTRPLYDALYEYGGDQRAAWEALKARLELQKRSHQWRVKQMIPRLDRWLSSGAHLQELPENPVATLVSEKTNRTLASAAEFIKDGTHGA